MLEYHTSDTICAPITPPGIGGISVVRVSGSAAFSVVRGLAGSGAAAIGEPNTSNMLWLTLGEGLVEQCVVASFVAPHSYTGEDVAEISCHGSPVLVDALVRRLTSSGIRLAQPGEFTKRAFLNGKLDLTQAEAVADLIASDSSRAAESAQRQLRGELRDVVNQLTARLIALCGLLELELDFVEEGFSFVAGERFLSDLELAMAEVDKLLMTYSRGRLTAHGLRIAIVGPPNVGKSSLLNAILGERRAIVSDQPGTTRDAVSAAIVHNGIKLEFWDTAGLRLAGEAIEAEGIEIGKERAEAADFVVCVSDADEEGLSGSPAEEREIRVRNKVDLLTEKAIPNKDNSMLRLSAKTGEGISGLLDHICRLQGLEAHPVGPMLTNARHFEAFTRAREALQATFDSLGKISPEFLVVHLRVAIDALGEISGATTSQEILDSIFARFCIGK